MAVVSSTDTMIRLKMSTRSSLRVIAPFVAGVLALLAGCAKREPSASAPQPSAVAESEPPSQWLGDAESPFVAIDSEPDEAAIAAAIRQARATADQARTRWLAASADDRARRWAVKWAAPTMSETGDGVEHVWVCPVNWSAFRIEGVLLSEPFAQLACGKTRGEIVGFPIEEISDWMHLKSDDIRGPRDGGFTMHVLEERFGRADSGIRH